MDVIDRQGLSVLYRVDEQVYFRVNAWEPNSECNSGYIVFTDHVAAIDATTNQSVRDMMLETQKLFKKPLTQIFLTHPHWDHVMGMDAVIENNLELICRSATAEYLRQSGMLLPQRMILFDKSLDIIEGDLHVHLFDEGCTTHSPWDMLIGLPKCGFVFTGDVCVVERMMFFGQSDVTSWIDFLPQLKKYTLLLRGHGDAVDPSYVDRQVSYLTGLKAVCLHLQEKYPDEDLNVLVAKAKGDPMFLDDPLIDALVAVTGDQAVGHIEQVLQSGQFKGVK